MLHHRSLYIEPKKAIPVAVMLLCLLILTTSSVFASSEADGFQSCLFMGSSGLANVSGILDIGSEMDARMISELDSSKCSMDELSSRISSGELMGYSLDLVLASSQGLAQDIRLGQELSSALEVVNLLSGPGRFGYLNQWW